MFDRPCRLNDILLARELRSLTHGGAEGGFHSCFLIEKAVLGSSVDHPMRSESAALTALLA
jgi:hypothetical protein